MKSLPSYFFYGLEFFFLFSLIRLFFQSFVSAAACPCNDIVLRLARQDYQQVSCCYRMDGYGR